MRGFEGGRTARAAAAGAHPNRRRGEPRRARCARRRALKDAVRAGRACDAGARIDAADAGLEGARAAQLVANGAAGLGLIHTRRTKEARRAANGRVSARGARRVGEGEGRRGAEAARWARSCRGTIACAAGRAPGAGAGRAVYDAAKRARWRRGGHERRAGADDEPVCARRQWEILEESEHTEARARTDACLAALHAAEERRDGAVWGYGADP